MSDAQGWRPIETMPMNRQVLVSDGALVKPGIRISADTVAAPILMSLGMWTAWQPLPAPPSPAPEDKP
jgi:hypothetical protein